MGGAQAPRSNYGQQSRGGAFSGLGGMLATGMAFGVGSAVAHQAIGGIAGGTKSFLCILTY